MLAGNPFADRFRRSGRRSGARVGGRPERVEPARARGHARRGRARARSRRSGARRWSPSGCSAARRRSIRRRDAAGYLAIVMVRQHRVAEAIALARVGAEPRRAACSRSARSRSTRPASSAGALDLLDPETTAATPPEDLAELTASIARHAPAHLPAVLARLPDDVALVPQLYNASFSVDRPRALQILRRVLALPEPAKTTGEARTALVMAWNNACIHAHAIGDYRLAVELAERRPAIRHREPVHLSLGCVRVRGGRPDRSRTRAGLARDRARLRARRKDGDRRGSGAVAE